MAGENLSKLIDRLPYSDGSYRRRFIAGGILTIGIVVYNWDSFRKIGIENVSSIDLLTSPIIAAGFILLIYAVGSILEMIGEIFLVRAASGMFWAIQDPIRRINYSNLFYRYSTRVLLWIFFVPFYVAYSLVKGLFGFTDYSIALADNLSPEAKELYGSLPDKVSEGLSQPVGDNTEIAWKHIVDKFSKKNDQKWVRKSIGKAKDVLAITTALVLLIMYVPLYKSINPAVSTPANFFESEVEIKNLIIDLQTQLISSNRRIRFTPEFEERSSEDQEEALEKIRDILEAIRKLTDKLVVQNEPANVFKNEEILKKLLDALKKLKKIVLQPDQKIENLFLQLSSEFELLFNKVDVLKETLEKRRYKNLLTIPILIIPLLFLYIGFFVTLRNSIVSILEVLALKEKVYGA